MSAHVSCFTGSLRGATKRHALLYIELYRINTVDDLFRAIKHYNAPHSIGKMKRHKLLELMREYKAMKEIEKLQEKLKEEA